MIYICLVPSVDCVVEIPSAALQTDIWGSIGTRVRNDFEAKQHYLTDSTCTPYQTPCVMASGILSAVLIQHTGGLAAV